MCFLGGIWLCQRPFQKRVDCHKIVNNKDICQIPQEATFYGKFVCLWWVSPSLTGQSKIGHRWLIKFKQPLCNYFSTDLHKKCIVGKVSLLSKRGYLVFENQTRNVVATAIWSDPTDRFRAWSIDARDLWTWLWSLHCYGNSKRPGMYTANDGKDASCRLAKERTFMAASQAKNDWIFCFSQRNATSFTQDHVSLAFEEVLHYTFLSLDSQWEDLSNSVSIVVLVLVFVEILLFEWEGQLWAF